MDPTVPQIHRQIFDLRDTLIDDLNPAFFFLRLHDGEPPSRLTDRHGMFNWCQRPSEFCKPSWPERGRLLDADNEDITKMHLIPF